jgi:hypothetical protein
LKDLDVDERIILKFLLKESDRRTWIGCLWLGIETNGRLLKTRS